MTKCYSYYRFLVTAIIVIASAHAPISAQDPRLCSVQGDPVAAAPFNLVDSYCIPSSTALGSVGSAFSAAGAGTFTANAAGQVDVFVIWEPGEGDVAAGETLSYSSSLTWTNPNPSGRFREWVGNFNVTPPVAYPITDTNDAATTPAELVRTDTSATVTNRSFSAIPGPIGRYHIQILGLSPGEEVVFSKQANGGHVSAVPEPTSAVLGLLAFGSVGLVRRRR